jgi:hypothetical protein
VVGAGAGGAEVCGGDVVLCGAGFAEVGGAAGAAGEDVRTAEGLVAAAGAGAVVAVLVLCETIAAARPAAPECDAVDWQALAARTVTAQAKADAHFCRAMGPLPSGRRPPPAGPHLRTLGRLCGTLNARASATLIPGPGESRRQR